VFVPHKTLSGMEKKIGYAGLSMALAAKAPCRIILVDELGVIDVQNRFNFLSNMRVAVKMQVVEQFIGIDVDQTVIGTQDFKGEDVAVIEVNK
jgi:hypothetical protein